MARMLLVTLPMFMLVLGLGTGCSSLTKDKGSKKDSPFSSLQFWKKGYQQPAKMAVLWSHDILTVAGKPPTRGFGGRIYFYNNKSQTIPVEGELVVHGFDETGKKASSSADAQPDKRFRFTAEQFTEHFSESDLGASYSVWIPWDAVDGVQKEITLIPTFVSSKGEMVQGAAAKVVLPGRTGSQPDQHTPVQSVAYEQASIPSVEGKLPNLVMPASSNTQPSASAGASAGTMRTTTINLPGAARRAQAVASNQAAAVGMMQQGAAAAPTNSYLEQARAQALADAFQPTEQLPQRPVQSYSSWNPNAIPTAGSTAVNLVNIAPPNQQPTSQYGLQTGMPIQPQMQQQMQPQAPAQPQMQPQMQPQFQPRNNVPVANPMNQPRAQAAPASGDEYPGGLPPGIQLSPRATAW